MPTPAAQAGAAASPWARRMALLTAGLTCALILAGGLVTNTGSGLAVPDWPTTFGHNMFLYPLSQMAGGVLYEHSHRLLGSLVGLCTVGVAAALFLTDGRSWARTLGVVAVLAVVVQGILGGLRVVLVEHALAMIHGAIAPAFLALLGSIALVTSPAWHVGAAGGGEALRRLRPLALGVVAVLYVQIVFGVILTHTGLRLDAHLLVAGAVSVLVPLLARRALGQGIPVMDRPARLLRSLWALQLLLGVGAYAARFHAGAVGGALALGFPLAHRLTGAVMLAVAVVLALQLFRLSAAAPVPERAAVADRVPA